MRNILAHVPQKGKDSFAAQLKEIWLSPPAELARQRAKQLSERYEKRFSKAIEILEEGLEDSLAFYAFPEALAQGYCQRNSMTMDISFHFEGFYKGVRFMRTIF